MKLHEHIIETRQQIIEPHEYISIASTCVHTHQNARTDCDLLSTYVEQVSIHKTSVTYDQTRTTCRYQVPNLAHASSPLPALHGRSRGQPRKHGAHRHRQEFQAGRTSRFHWQRRVRSPEARGKPAKTGIVGLSSLPNFATARGRGQNSL